MFHHANPKKTNQSDRKNKRDSITTTNFTDVISRFVIFLSFIFLLRPIDAEILYSAETASAGKTQDRYPGIAKIIGRGEIKRTPEGETQTLFYGSGVYVAEMGEIGIVLTNWHVVDGAVGFLEVDFPNFRTQGAIILADEVWDLTALVIRRPPFLPFPISLEVPQIGSELWAGGYGQSSGLEGFQLSSGPVLCYSTVGKNEDLPMETLCIGCGIREGDSGGPILNRYGELAGLLWGSDGSLMMGTFGLRVQAFLTQAQFQAMNQPSKADRFFAKAAAGKIPAKKITMPAISAQQALASSGVYPISSQPIYLRGRLPAPERSLPWFYKPVADTEVVSPEDRQPPEIGGDSLGLPSSVQNGHQKMANLSRDFQKRKDQYRAAHRNGYSLPPWPPMESPTLSAQRRSIGRANPEVYPAEFLTAMFAVGDAVDKNEALGEAGITTANVTQTASDDSIPAAEKSKDDNFRNVSQSKDELPSQTKQTVQKKAESSDFHPVADSVEPVSGNDKLPSEGKTAAQEGSVTPTDGSATPTDDSTPKEGEKEKGNDESFFQKKIPGFSHIPLSDFQVIVVLVITLFLFVNSLRLLSIAAERAEKKKESKQ